MLTARQGLLALATGCAALYACWFLIVEKPQADRAAAFKADMLKQINDVHRKNLFDYHITKGEIEALRRR